MTYRLLVDVFVAGLPPESLTRTAQRNEYSDEQLAQMGKQQTGHGPFSHLELLVTHLIDEVAWNTYAVSAVNGGKPKEPKPYPRPGVPGSGPRKGRLTPQQMAQLDAINPKRG